MIKQLRIVPFDIWNMAIDVPYSMLAGKGKQAWTCGQLAMDKNAQVVEPYNLRAQCNVVAAYIEEVLKRGGLGKMDVRRLVLYYVGNLEDANQMIKLFANRFGDTAVLDPVPVPEYYYDGVMLEVDAFCSGEIIQSKKLSHSNWNSIINLTASEAWVNLESHISHLEKALPSLREELLALGVVSDNTLNEHWVSPTGCLEQTASINERLGQEFDPFAILDGGNDIDNISVRAVVLLNEKVTGEVENKESVCLLSRQSHSDVWIQARNTNSDADLVDQTKINMEALSEKLEALGLNFSDVIKQTTHYVGGTADQLHDNMSVRNSYYRKPGPGSTGIPVFGVADNSAKCVIDLRIMKNWRG